MSSTTTYLIIDPGTQSGWAVFKAKAKTATLVKYSHYDIKSKSEWQGDKDLEYEEFVDELIKTHSPDIVVREGYFFSYGARKGSEVNVYYRGVIDMVSRRYKLPYKIIQPAEWKRFICGRTRPTKSQKKVWGGNADKIMVQDGLWKEYKIRFPNFCISSKNRTVKFRYDTIDAVAIGVYYCRIYARLNKIINEVPLLQDRSLGRNIVQYDYSGVKAPIKEKGCQYVFKSGKKEGKRCGVVPRKPDPILGTKWCSSHLPKKAQALPKVKEV